MSRLIKEQRELLQHIVDGNIFYERNGNSHQLPKDIIYASYYSSDGTLYEISNCGTPKVVDSNIRFESRTESPMTKDREYLYNIVYKVFNKNIINKDMIRLIHKFQHLRKEV